jgi:hypothetical protein
MVKKAGGDIEGLFRSFGSDSGSYRELAREADARDAQQRWPMLGEIAPEAGVRPDALDAASKRQWRERGEGDAEVPLPPPQASAEQRQPSRWPSCSISILTLLRLSKLSWKKLYLLPC